MIRLANSPATHLTKVAQSIFHMSRIGFPDYGVRPHVASASSMVQFKFDIVPADWDALFQAISTRLESCVSQALTHAQTLPLHERHADTCKTVLECVEDMRQLHTALIQERMAQHGSRIYAGN